MRKTNNLFLIKNSDLNDLNFLLYEKKNKENQKEMNKNKEKKEFFPIKFHNKKDVQINNIKYCNKTLYGKLSSQHDNTKKLENKNNSSGINSFNENSSLNSNGKSERILSKMNRKNNMAKTICDKKKIKSINVNHIYDDNIMSNTISITDLLNQTEKDFKKLEEKNNANNLLSVFIMNKFYKMKIKEIFNKAKKKNKNSDKIKIIKKPFYRSINKKKANIHKNFGSVYDNYHSSKKDLNSTNNFNKYFSFRSNKKIIDYNLLNANLKTMKKYEKACFKHNSDNKILINKIIQTLDDNKDINKEPNILLPFLSTYMEKKEPSNNRIKIAEIKQINPVAIMKKKSSISPLNNRKINNNIYRRILFDINENLSDSYKNNSECVMNRIKYGIMNNK